MIVVVATLAVGCVLACAAVGWVVAQGPLALRSIGAQKMPAGDHLRWQNLVAGFASDLRTGAPSLWIVGADAPNALIVRYPRPAVAVSSGLLLSYTRTEIEAVVAHCILRLLDESSMRRMSVAVAVGRTGHGAGPGDDLKAASLTRYPPGLAAAISKAEPAIGRFAPFWFVAEAPGPLGPFERAAELLDL